MNETSKLVVSIMVLIKEMEEKLEPIVQHLPCNCLEDPWECKIEQQSTDLLYTVHGV